MAPKDSRKTTSGLVSSVERKRARCGRDKKTQDSANDEAASALINAIEGTSPPDLITAIQNSYRSDLDNFLAKTPTELEQAEAALYHQLSLISEVKALNNLPGGKLEKFILFNKLPIEIQKIIWEEAVSQEREVFVIEAYRTKTQPAFRRKIVHFKCVSKLDPLLKACVRSREAVLKFRSTAVGVDLPGFEGTVHINSETDLVVLDNINDAFSTRGIMKAVKKVVVTSDSRFLHPRHLWGNAIAINKMFPDLTTLFLVSSTRDNRSYVKSPNDFKLIPMTRVSITDPMVRTEDWSETWAEMQESLGIDTVCPELKMMRMVKRT